MDKKVLKFENPVRLAELSPAETLVKAGFQAGMTLCDIGAGSGIFSFPAAKISEDNVYALEISDGMIELLEERKAEYNQKNLVIRKVESENLPLEDNLCDMTLMTTVFHEIEDKEMMLKEIKRVLKETGKLFIIEFHKRETPFGPPVEHRISEAETEEIILKNGFMVKEKITLGVNFYGIIFEKQ